MLVKKVNNQYFPSIFDVFFNDENLKKGNLFTRPDYNVYEEEKEFVIEFAIPGLGKNDFKIEVKNDILEISCEKEVKEEEAENKSQNYIYKGFSYGSFKNSFTLPENVNKEMISAIYDDGILKVVIPKDDEAKVSRQITVS